MLRKSFSTIRGRMMIFYTCLIAAATLILSTVYYRHAARSLEQQAYESLLSLSVTNSAVLDAAVESMDVTARHIVASELLKNAFYQETRTEFDWFQNKRELISLLYTVNGPDVNRQIHLSALSGKHVKFGITFDMTDLDKDPDQSLCQWTNICLAQDGKMTVIPPHPCSLNEKNAMVLSVSRAFGPVFSAPCDAVVEVQMRYEDLEALVQNAVLDSPAQVFIYDAQGQLICPYTTSDTVRKYEAAISIEKNQGYFPVSDGSFRGIAAYCRSTYTGLTMVICEDNATLMEPLRAFQIKMVLVSLLLILCAAVLSQILSRQLTEPICRIQDSISQLELSDLHLQEDLSSTRPAYELDKLQSAYTQMVERLLKSLEETVTARSQEAEARMEALQAQMSPHFLYNTITVISIKAEESDDYEVVAMCECLTEMLRYVTRDTRPDVSLQEELDYLQQYLYLMHCRFPGKFTVSVEVPEEMTQLNVPKLVVQPLVENCFKHGFLSSDPWTVSLVGTVEEDRWQITVTDNGVGLQDAALEELRKRFAQATGNFQSDAADHIGLVNIFERLRYRYRDQALFQIENLPQGGCRVQIGGVLEPIAREAFL